MNKVPNSFQIVKPSRTEARTPADAINWGETVASAEGEMKLPVMLTMMSNKVTGEGTFSEDFLRPKRKGESREQD